MISLFVFTSCNDSTPTQPIDDPDLETQGDFDEFNEVVLDFAYESLLFLNNREEENLLFSPLSIESALYMTMNGTDGKTLEEFRTALRIGSFYSNGINTHYKTLLEKLDPKDNRTSLSSNNTVFFDDQWVDLDENFINVIKDNFEAEATDADFSDPSTVDLINNWAEENTEGKIKEVIKEIKQDEVLFLINALYFISDWEIGFDPDYTFPNTFTKSDGSEVTAPFMVSDDIRNYVITEDYSAVDLMLKGQDYSMTFILPSEDPKAFIGQFNLSSFKTWINELYQGLQNDRLQLDLPKFEMANKFLLNDMLIDMGMETAFDSANLDRMGQFYGGQTYISRVIHDAFLKIDEKGIEGAAVTTVGVGVESLPPSINLNRPFIFVVRHVETNTPIFIGKMGDPS